MKTPLLDSIAGALGAMHGTKILFNLPDGHCLMSAMRTLSTQFDLLCDRTDYPQDFAGEEANHEPKQKP